MVTLAVPRQTEAASQAACMTDGDFGDAGASCTATPEPQDAPAWLSDDDRAILIHPETVATVVSVSLEFAARNGLGPSLPPIESISVNYPYQYSLEEDTLKLRMQGRRRVPALLRGLLGSDFADVEAEAMSVLRQR
jgi:hypothetical protein